MKWIRNVKNKIQQKIGGFIQKHRFGLTEVQYAHVLDCIDEGHRVKAVRAVRSYTSLSLKDANHVVGVMEDAA